MNRYKRHVYVIPEDDRDRQIADGFVLHDQVKDTRIQVVPPAGGWAKVLDTFRDEYISKLRDYPAAHVVMLIDFDDDVQKRQAKFEQEIPEQYKTRVFVVGSKHNPETLKKALKIGFEEIGKFLANDCAASTTEFWDHEQLQHNDTERQRLVQTVKPFLF
jgi:hypothetical protein